jgi:hypothetical protein
VHPAANRWSWLVADALVAAWAVLWIVLGVAVAREVRQLEELSETVIIAGQALEQTSRGLRGTSDGLRETGRALEFVEQIPFARDIIGDELEDAATELDAVADDVSETARSARASGESSRESVNDLATLLGLSVALIPSVPALLAYVLLRFPRLRAGFRRPAA